MPFPDHRARRRHLAQRLQDAGGGVALLAAAPERQRSRDSDHPFRQDSHFDHLTGFDEPHSWLLLRSDGHAVLFCRAPDPDTELWEGHRLGHLRAPDVLGVDEAHPIDRLDELMPSLLADAPAVWRAADLPADAGDRLARWCSAHAGSIPRPGPAPWRDLSLLLDEMRLFKDPHELITMRRAAAISASAHRRAMAYSGARFQADPAAVLREYEIEAELLHEFRRHGAQSPAYPSIVAGGANSCVLHHAAGAAPLRTGQLCLIDAGCELDGYASDITRTFPVNGRFTAPQRALYDIVLAAQDAAVAATRPGARQRDAHDAAVKVLAQGMLDTGLLDRRVHGAAEDVVQSAAYRRFYMHGTGHWLGRDVHDVGEYLALDEAPCEQADGQGGTVVRPPSRRLQPGMVVTLEPGLYVRAADDVPECFHDLGLRIEDDAIVTATGCELISRGAPVLPDEIEALMRG